MNGLKRAAWIVSSSQIVHPSQVVSPSQVMHPSQIMRSSQVVRLSHFLSITLSGGNELYHMTILSASVFHSRKWNMPIYFFSRLT